MKAIARYIRLTALFVKHVNRTIRLEECARRVSRLIGATRRPGYAPPVESGE
jgi:hypothetical protein